MNNHNLTIVLATHNQNKLKEIKAFTNNLNYQFMLLSDITSQEAIEDGESFESNALIKAQFCYNKTQLISLSEDSGLSIDCLNGAPGIYSKRWAIDDNYEIAFKKIQQLMQHSTNLNAKFVSTFCLYYNPDKYYFFKGELEGKISFPPTGNFGFGYDPIFIPNGHSLTLAEMTLEKKNKISHRNQALNLVFKHLNSYE